jgi:DNA-binding NarL/FixJ family response regulator
MNSALRGCVAVASDQPLVADVIAAGLSGNGFRCLVLGWPGGADRGATRTEWHEGRPVPSSDPALDVALLVSDFDRVARIRGAVRLILEVPTPWVVLTGASRGPLWGALLELGSTHVAAATTDLDEITEILGAVVDGRVVTPEPERIMLIAAWWDVLNEHEDVMARLAAMTPRETEVLRLLYAGSPVRVIAQHFGVAEATVRTQVKRVLRKLEVSSQLAAVAAFERVGRADASRDGTDVVATTMWLGRQVAAPLSAS